MSIEVRIAAIETAAAGVTLFTLAPAAGGYLPSAPAGAHIRLDLPGGRERCYSLVQAPDVAGHYQIAVALQPAGAGGSRHLCETARVGDRLTLAGPFDGFNLAKAETEAETGTNAPPRSILIAGGIGITPIWSMIQHLERWNRPWQLHYAIPRREAGAFLDALTRLDRTDRPDAPRVHVGVSSDGAAARLDIERIVGQATSTDHLYCCGPDRMLAEFRSATSARDPSTVHWEYFEAPTAPNEPTAATRRYTLELRRSERTLIVEPGATVLDTLLSAGIDAPYGCRQGICGSCEVGVLDGTPDHRDLVLSDEERAANRTMMPCCSGCIGERLVLDL